MSPLPKQVPFSVLQLTIITAECTSLCYNIQFLLQYVCYMHFKFVENSFYFFLLSSLDIHIEETVKFSSFLYKESATSNLLMHGLPPCA